MPQNPSPESDLSTYDSDQAQLQSNTPSNGRSGEATPTVTETTPTQNPSTGTSETDESATTSSETIPTTSTGDTTDATDTPENETSTCRPSNDETSCRASASESESVTSSDVSSLPDSTGNGGAVSEGGVLSRGELSLTALAAYGILTVFCLAIAFVVLQTILEHGLVHSPTHLWVAFYVAFLTPLVVAIGGARAVSIVTAAGEITPDRTTSESQSQSAEN